MSTSPSELLRQEFDHYKTIQSQLVEKFNGKVIVLMGGDVLGVFESELDAMTQTKKRYEIGTFLIQKVTEGEEAYSQTFQSRMVL